MSQRKTLTDRMVSKLKRRDPELRITVQDYFLRYPHLAGPDTHHALPTVPAALVELLPQWAVGRLDPAVFLHHVPRLFIGAAGVVRQRDRTAADRCDCPGGRPAPEERVNFNDLES